MVDIVGAVVAPTFVQPIREEIRVLAATPQEDGSPAWQLLDPVRNRFFRIGWLEFELLLRWNQAEASAIATSVTEETTLHATSDDVEALNRFLQHHELVQLPGGRAAPYLAKRAEGQRGTWLKQLLHHYLFIRIPLIHPEKTLNRIERRTRWIYGRAFWISTALALVIGGILAARQLDTVLVQLSDSMNFHGVIGYTVALMFAKSLHELGHAITATRYGVRVAHMGVALVVMAPMLYTDTGESWKLTNHRDRLKIAVAGVAAELVLAVWATLAWGLLPDGPVRSAMFFLATTSWVLSVLVNASPFMRFDGYFIVADALNLPNLHERSAALAQRRMHAFLFGVSEPDREYFPPKKARLLALFSAVTWVYRMVVFFGIALAVYHYFFKLLGIFLFAVELGWFIILPIWRELREWPALTQQVSTVRKTLYGLMALALLGLIFLPWSSSVYAPGWVFPANQRVIYSPQAARVVAMPFKENQNVQAGQVVFELEAPELKDSAQQATILAEAYSRQAANLPVISERGEALSAKAMQQSREMMQQAHAQSEASARLKLVAPFSGTFQDATEGVEVGTWVNSQLPLGRLVDAHLWRAELLVPEQALDRVALGQTVKLYQHHHAVAPVIGQVTSIDAVRVTVLPHAMLDVHSGGSIVTHHEHNRDVATEALYRVGITLPANVSLTNEALCEGRIEAKPQSLWQRWLPPLLAVLVRESGF